MTSLPVVCLILTIAAGGTDLDEDLNTSAFRKLWEATQERDPSVYPILHRVLLDMAGQRYAYLKDVRLTAFDYIRETGDHRALPLLKKIAQIDYVDDESGETTLDLIAIRGALDALVSFGSEDAAELNLRHIHGNAWVQTTAIGNLRELEYWEATLAVEKVFCSKLRIRDNFLVFLRAAEFLSTSPETTGGICACVEEVTGVLQHRTNGPTSIFHQKLGEALKSLDRRFACEP